MNASTLLQNVFVESNLGLFSHIFEPKEVKEDIKDKPSLTETNQTYQGTVSITVSGVFTDPEKQTEEVKAPSVTDVVTDKVQWGNVTTQAVCNPEELFTGCNEIMVYIVHKGKTPDVGKFTSVSKTLNYITRHTTGVARPKVAVEFYKNGELAGHYITTKETDDELTQEYAELQDRITKSDTLLLTMRA